MGGTGPAQPNDLLGETALSPFVVQQVVQFSNHLVYFALALEVPESFLRQVHAFCHQTTPKQQERILKALAVICGDSTIDAFNGITDRCIGDDKAARSQ